MKSKQYDKNAWEKLGDAFTNNYEQGLLNYRKNIIEIVLEHQDECENLLDIACADGWFASQLRMFGFYRDYLGVDITPNLIERAKIRMPGERFEINDAMNLDGIEDASFDFVMCVGILMHLPDIKAAIHEACRVSKKYVLFSTYGTYGQSYSIYDSKNGFLNNYYNPDDIMTVVPKDFELQHSSPFRRNNSYMFQYLYKHV